MRDAWLAGGPQPLAESVAVLDAPATPTSPPRSSRNLLRYLLAVALATHVQTRESRDDPALLRLVRGRDRRELSTAERDRLVRLLVRPLTRRRAHPIPGLVDLVTPDPDGADGLDPLLTLPTAAEQAVTEDAVRLQLMRVIPELTQLLRRTAFVLDHVLVVPQRHAAERWTGRRHEPRAVMNVPDGARRGTPDAARPRPAGLGGPVAAGAGGASDRRRGTRAVPVPVSTSMVTTARSRSPGRRASSTTTRSRATGWQRA